MRIPRSLLPIVHASLTIVILNARAGAGPAKPPEPPPDHRRPYPSEEELKAFLKPRPVVIPDDPPPHEGAMIDLPYVAEPSDLLDVEVLEALPGRPISGERLIRPDGTISLGFYGVIHVRGLTLEQIKTKIILHLRASVTDQVLGLVETGPELPPDVPAPPPDAPPSPMPNLPFPGQVLPPAGTSPFDVPEDVRPPRSLPPSTPAGRLEPAPQGPNGPSGEKERPRVRKPPRRPESARSRRPARRLRPTGQPAEAREDRPTEPAKPSPIPPPPGDAPPGPGGNESVPDGMPVPPPGDALPGTAPASEPEPTFIHPADSNRVFVDVTAYNSPYYYVLGYVAKPGRLPFTGHDTVQDVLQYCGGLAFGYDPKKVHLVRPLPGGKTKVYRVDLDAIINDPRANYQIFPGDRLLVDSSEMTKKKIAIDRLAGSLKPVMESMKLYADMVRSLNKATSGTSGKPGLSPKQRDQILKDWADLWWKSISKPGGAELDEKTFRESLLRHLNPPESRAVAKEKRKKKKK